MLLQYVAKTNTCYNMKIIEQIERLTLLHKLIQDERTGNPDELANRLGVSRGTLYNMIEELRSYDVSVSYSRARQSFVYDRDSYVEIQYSIKVIENKEELNDIDGGMALFSFRSIFYTEE